MFTPAHFPRSHYPGAHFAHGNDEEAAPMTVLAVVSRGSFVPLLETAGMAGYAPTSEGSHVLIITSGGAP